MSISGKGKVPEWVQITVQKSKLGFNRVHDELKRLYDERVRKNTTVDSVANPTFGAFVSKRSGVVSKLSRFIGSVKGSLSRFKSGRQFQHYENSAALLPDSKFHFVDTNNSSLKRHVSVESNQSSAMPHAELIKSTVYTNDRVVQEWVEDVNNELKNESCELYAEIDDDTNCIDDSESLFRLEVDFKSPKQGHEISGFCASHKNIPSGVDKHHNFTSSADKNHILTSVEGEHNYCTLHENGQHTSTYVDMENRYVNIPTKTFTIPPPDKKKITKKSCSMKRWSKPRKARYTQLSRSLPTELFNESKDMNTSCSMCITSNPSIKSNPLDEEPVSRENNTKDRRDRSQWKIFANKNKSLMSSQTHEVKQEKQTYNHPDIDRSFFDYTVEEVVDCFKKCAFIGLAQTCLDEQLDGEYFRDITADDLVQEPFNMNWFHISKLFKVINGWRPKKCRRSDEIKF